MQRGKENIVLSGFMGSGKTSVGNELSHLTGMPFLDTDALIEEEAGERVHQIFSKGEEEFRALEREKIEEVCRERGVVVAVGGGAVLEPLNVRRLKEGGIIYYLEVSAEEAIKRVPADGTRPLFDPAKAEELLKERKPAYARAADVIVKTDGRTPLEVALEVLGDWKRRKEGSRV
ncbi:MAG: shikimate kinase [Actinomycetota bacterium]|nr:shikimate kinase [Actinomycetota bacterium]